MVVDVENISQQPAQQRLESEAIKIADESTSSNLTTKEKGDLLLRSTSVSSINSSDQAEKDSSPSAVAMEEDTAVLDSELHHVNASAIADSSNNLNLNEPKETGVLQEIVDDRPAGNDDEEMQESTSDAKKTDPVDSRRDENMPIEQTGI